MAQREMIKRSYKDFSLYKKYKVRDRALKEVYNKGYTILGMAILLKASSVAVRERILYITDRYTFKRKPIPKEMKDKVIKEMNKLRSIKEVSKKYPYAIYELQQMTLGDFKLDTDLPISTIIELYVAGYSFSNIAKRTRFTIHAVKQVLVEKGYIKGRKEDEIEIDPRYLRRGKISYTGVSI